MPEQSLTEDATQIRAAMISLMRRMSHPTVQQQMQERAGVELDKVSEIVMSCLDDVGCDLRLSDVSARLGVELSSVSRKVQKMEEAGHLTRSTDPSDGRASRLQLTDSGRAILDALNGARRNLCVDVLVSWPDQDRRQLTELITRFSNDLTTHLEGDK